jgi:L-alanine-DL-glutamate epimerase-like enolase superfamily enzyme
MFDTLIRRTLDISTAEIRLYTGQVSVSNNKLVSAVRRLRHLPLDFKVRHYYLRLIAPDRRTIGEYGPLQGTEKVLTDLSYILKFIGKKTSLLELSSTLRPYRTAHPLACLAIEAALWDMLARSEKTSFWSLIRRFKSEMSPRLPFYGSILGIDISAAGILLEVLANGYELAKWSLQSVNSIDDQLHALKAVVGDWNKIALDGHGNLSVEDVLRIAQSAGEIAWLEDPFGPATHQWNDLETRVLINREKVPWIITGETMAIDEISAFLERHHVFGLNLEVERIGLTDTVILIRQLARTGQLCCLHGRALILAAQLAMAFSEVVKWIEVHLVFATERLGSMNAAVRFTDSRDIAYHCLSNIGLGIQPNNRIVQAQVIKIRIGNSGR